MPPEQPITSIPVPPPQQEPKNKSNFVHILLVIIALFVVVVFVGASYIMSSLNDAHDNGEDASIKSTLNNARSLAEIHYSMNGNSYVDFCTSENYNSLLGSIDGAVDCVDAQEQYRISSVLKNGGYYCVMMDGTKEEYISEAVVVMQPPFGFVCQ